MSDARPVEVVAHRGASAHVTENTLAAFALARRQGCDAIELDLQLTRDEVPVVFHDRTLVRAGGGRRRVRSLDVRELRQLDAAARRDDPHRRRIPLLEEVLDRYASTMPLLLEIKLRDSAERLRRLVDRTLSALRGRRVPRPVRLLSFEPAVLEYARRREAGVATVLNVRARDASLGRIGRFLDGLSAVSVQVRGATPRLGDGLTRRGLPLYVFTCNTSATVSRALAAGATAVMSDRPGWLRERLDR